MINLRKSTNWTSIKPDVHPEELLSLKNLKLKQCKAHPTRRVRIHYSKSCHKDGPEDPDLERRGILQKRP